MNKLTLNEPASPKIVEDIIIVNTTDYNLSEDTT